MIKILKVNIEETMCDLGLSKYCLFMTLKLWSLKKKKKRKNRRTSELQRTLLKKWKDTLQTGRKYVKQ